MAKPLNNLHISVSESSGASHAGAAAPDVGRLVAAAKDADWQQVVLNGGPPCFHFEAEEQRFCLRAERWAGHTDKNQWPEHRFVSLADVMLSASRAPKSAPDVERLRQRAADVRAWRSDERSGYDSAIALLCDVEHDLEEAADALSAAHTRDAEALKRIRSMAKQIRVLEAALAASSPTQD